MKLISSDKILHVRTFILDSLKNVEVGTRLLPEREFATLFGVSRHVVRKAVDELVDAGILKRVVGSGVYVCRKPDKEPYTIAVLTAAESRADTKSFGDIIDRYLHLEIHSRGAVILPAFLEDHEIPPAVLNDVDGIITTCGYNENTLVAPKPMVTYFVELDDHYQNCSYINIDDELEGRRAAEYLIDLGHVRLAFIGDMENYYWSKKRWQGVLSIAATHGVPEPIVIHNPYNKPLSYRIAHQLKSAGVTAVVCANDYLSITLVSVLHSAGINVPGDISVIGYDDVPAIASFQPPLTTIRQPLAEGAKLALDELIARIESKTPIESRHIALPGEVVTRLSCQQLKNFAPL